MAKNMNLTAEVIYNKEFHVDMKGYAPAEVDEFLDQVIEDYQNYDEKIDEMGQLIARYEEKIKELNQEIYILNTDRGVQEEVAPQDTGNVDILKRIARLEEAVFGADDAD